jgi:cell division protein FtsZ
MRAPVRLVRDATTGLPIDDAFAGDPVASAVGGLGLRRGGAAGGASAAAAAPAPAAADLPSDYLDIPAFLRRQAD